MKTRELQKGTPDVQIFVNNYKNGYSKHEEASKLSNIEC